MTVTTSYIPVNLSNITSFSGILQAANNSAAGYLFFAIDILVFLVLTITLAATFQLEAALLTSGFICLILSLLFVYMGVMSYMMAGIFVGVIVLGILIVTWSRND